MYINIFKAYLVCLGKTISMHSTWSCHIGIAEDLSVFGWDAALLGE